MAALCVRMSVCGVSAAEQKADKPLPWEETGAQRDARMQWWRDAKFGMFIHYGIYSGLAGEFKGRKGGAEWIQTNLGLSSAEYAAEALPKFCPARGCTEQWAELAKAAGCRYAVLTSKHHDGFGLFDSAETDFCTGKAIKRDLVKEFADSFRSRGMKVGLYHGVIDWHHPDYDNTIPAFYAIAMVRTQRGSEEISAFRGLAKTNPRTAFLVTVAFASLAGVPLTLGFIAKLKAFLALIDTMTVFDGLSWLLVIMIICAAAGFYYYFKIIRAMYWEKPLPEDKPLQVPGITTAVLAISAAASIILGSLPLLITSGS